MVIILTDDKKGCPGVLGQNSKVCLLCDVAHGRRIRNGVQLTHEAQNQLLGGKIVESSDRMAPLLTVVEDLGISTMLNHFDLRLR